MANITFTYTLSTKASHIDRPGISGVAKYTLLTGRTEVFSPHMEKGKDA